MSHERTPRETPDGTGDTREPDKLTAEQIAKLRTAAEERAFNALLSEAIGGPSPPELSDIILQRFHQERLDQQELSGATPASDETAAAPASTIPSRRRELIGAFTIIATVAASLLLLLAWRARWQEEPRLDQLAERKPAAEIEQVPQPQPTEADAPAPPQQQPIRGIPLLAERDEAEEVDPVPVPDPGSAAQPREPSQPLQLVSRQVNSALRDYWQALKITPASDRSPQRVVDWLQQRLGVTLRPDTLDDAAAVARQLKQPNNAEEVSAKWLELVTEGRVNRLDPPEQGLLRGQLSRSVQGQVPFDRLLANWLSGNSDASSAWYSAVAPGGRPAMLNRLGSLTMNVDLRCTRCHDSLISGDGTQKEYWSFAAFLRNNIMRDRSGRWSAVPPETERRAVFYDQPDGTRRLAEPNIPEAWISGEGSGELSDGLDGWAEVLVGSRELARGVINSLWELVYGRALEGRVIDPMTTPNDAGLERLQRQLIDDLLASRFDIGRSLSLIISSPATGKAIPPEPVDETWLAASSDAEQAAAAFAAAKPAPTSLPLGRKLAVVMRSIGGRLDVLTEGTSLLAQAAGVDETGDGRRSRRGNNNAARQNQFPPDYPTEAESADLPVQWLASVDGLESQVSHLAYLAGLTQPPKAVLEAAVEMREAELSNELILQRVWWLLKE